MRVDLDHVGHRYADGPLLFHDLTASLMPGHVYALTGPSGAGKSTLLGIIAGWTTPAEGQVTRQGIDSMRWIFQNPHGVCVLSSCYRPVWREFSFRKSGRF